MENTKKIVRRAENKTVGAFLLKYAFYIMFVVMIIIFSVFTERFMSFTNITQLLGDSASFFALCCGITFVILCGKLDLSVGTTMLVAGNLCLVVNTTGSLPWVVVLIMSLALGVIIGAFNGFMVTVLKMNPFIATMGTMITSRGLIITYSRGDMYYTKGAMKDILSYRIGGSIPVLLIVAIILVLVLQYILRNTKFGRDVIAVGCNNASAQKMGINVKRINFSVYVLSGLFAAIAGIISVHNVGIASPATGNGLEFTGSCMVLLGGTSLFGGKGNFFPGIFFGVLFLMVVQNGLAILGLNPYAIVLIRGAIIFIAMFMDSIKNMNKV